VQNADDYQRSYFQAFPQNVKAVQLTDSKININTSRKTWIDKLKQAETVHGGRRRQSIKVRASHFIAARNKVSS
jgi:hypothetical protein